MKNKILGGQKLNRMMAKPSHDNYALERFVQEYIFQINTTFHSGLKKFTKQKELTHINDLNISQQRKNLLQHPYGQMWSSLRRIAREWTCEAVGPTAETQLETLINKANSYIRSNKKLGSLLLNPELKIPKYIDLDIHLKPGGYFAELCENDIFAGAEYERTTFLNSNGFFGPKMDLLGTAVADWVLESYPKLKVRRILEIGCAIGQSTIAWKDKFPSAEVFGIDLGAPMLRYGHARAESLRKKIHFSQQNGEKTSFPDSFFDLVVSHATLHETSLKALKNILFESYRILNTGGLMIHNEGMPFRNMKPIDRIIPDWDTHFNAEPFITKMRSLDLSEFAVQAGWPKHSTRNDIIRPNKKNKNSSLQAFYLLVGERP